MPVEPSSWTTKVYFPYLEALKKNDWKTVEQLRWKVELIHKLAWKGSKNGN